MAEDDPADAELVLEEVRRAGFAPDWHRVQTEAAFLARLGDDLDLVLSDYQMPAFNGLRALELLKQSGLDVPFILVSGTIGEDLAVVAMKNGAADYLLKDRLVRLGPAITHALAERQLRRERRLAEEAAQRQLSELRVLFDLMPAMIWFKDTQDRILQVNQQAAEAAGRPVEEIEGRLASEIYPETAAQFYADDLVVIRSGMPKLGCAEMLPGPAGRKLWVQTDKVPVRDKEGKITGIVVMAQDITERKQLEEQFRQTQKMEAIGTLAGGIAHDFNNILGAINGFTELARMALRENHPVVRQYLGSVLQASQRAADLVRQILTFSRQQPEERRPVQLRPIVAETFNLLRATIPSTIEFDLALAADAPTVLADTTQIHQVLMNLGTNAWYAMKDRTGRLQVKLERLTVDPALAASTAGLRAGEYARISVSDTGCGMDPETLRQIFDPFFTTKPLGEGTGLGLAVVRGIMDSHDGAITVSSDPGQGTAFRLYFPAHAGQAIVVPAVDKPVPTGHGERILFVDDEALLAFLGQETLTALGYQVEVATEPALALALVRADPQRFALVITDQTMPTMTGLVLAGKLREICADLPVILTTGYSLSLAPERVKAAGICRLLLKPTTIRSLGIAVDAAFAAKSSSVPFEIAPC